MSSSAGPDSGAEEKKSDNRLRWVSQKYPEMQFDAAKKGDSAVPAFRTISLDNAKIIEAGEETVLTKFLAHNPLVPFGCATTVGALVFGLRAMMRGDRVTQQKMMRLRVAAQGFTILALVSGTIYLKSQHKYPEGLAALDIDPEDVAKNAKRKSL